MRLYELIQTGLPLNNNPTVMLIINTTCIPLGHYRDMNERPFLDYPVTYSTKYNEIMLHVEHKEGL